MRSQREDHVVVIRLIKEWSMTPFDIVRSYIGMTEGPGPADNPKILEMYVSVRHWLEKAGIRSTRNLDVAYGVSTRGLLTYWRGTRSRREALLPETADSSFTRSVCLRQFRECPVFFCVTRHLVTAAQRRSREARQPERVIKLAHH